MKKSLLKQMIKEEILKEQSISNDVEFVVKNFKKIVGHNMNTSRDLNRSEIKKIEIYLKNKKYSTSDEDDFWEAFTYYFLERPSVMGSWGMGQY